MTAWTTGKEADVGGCCKSEPGKRKRRGGRRARVRRENRADAEHKHGFPGGPDIGDKQLSSDDSDC
jgi:hypothetical protein